VPVPELRMNGWIPVPWAEFIGKDGSHGASWNAGWGDGGTASTFQILINWDDGPVAEQAILGTSVFLDQLGVLSRTLPVQHPIWSNQYAERIVSATPLRWNAKIDQFESGALSISTGVPVSEYSYWHLVIGFAVPKYRVLSDAQLDGIYGALPRQEWQRFVEVVPEPHVETFSREGWMWVWSDNGAGGAGAPKVSASLTAPLGLSIYGETLHVRWRRLPRRGLFGQSGASPSFNGYLSGCLNQLRDGSFPLWIYDSTNCNTDTGILRLTGVNATPVASPFDALAQNLTPIDFNCYYDVDMVFSLWDPPAGNKSYRGWNLAPNPGDNLWYLVNSWGTTRIFGTTDLSVAFTLSLT